MKKAFELVKRIFFVAAPISLFFLFWEIGGRYVPRGVLSSPGRVIHALTEVLSNGVLLKHTGISLQRVGMGFALAGAAGLVMGFLLGSYFKRLERLFLPFFRICEKLNPFAIIPVFMILFGIGTEQKVAVIFWAAFWPILFNTQEGAKSVDPQMIRAARSMGAKRFRVFTEVILPHTGPSIFTGLKIAARVSFFMIIASEVIGSSSGLGWYYVQQTIVYKLDLVYGVILYITLLAILTNELFRLLERRFLTWKTEAFK